MSREDQPHRERTFRDSLVDLAREHEKQVDKTKAAIDCIDANPGLLELLEIRDQQRNGGCFVNSRSL